MRLHIPGFLLAAAIGVASAQGGSAIVTLVMPPPGGEGYSALQSGAALPVGAASMNYNPALMAELQRSTGSQLFYTRSQQRLLPRFVQGVAQDYWSVTAVAPDAEGGTDMAVGFFRNTVDFGKNYRTDASGAVIDAFDSWERVYGLGTAIRLGMPISIGANAKFFESHLADGLPGIKPALGWAFDVGVLANPRLAPPAGLGLPALAFTPSFALVAKNLGPDIFYEEARHADPIPTTYTAAFGFKFEAADVLEVTGGWDADQEWTHRSENWNQVRVLGFSGRLGFLRYGEAWLDDPSGKRYEKHVSRSLELDFLALHKIALRCATRDWSTPSSALEGGSIFPAAKMLGTTFRANPRLEAGIREIESDRGGIRGGQKSRYYLALSL